MDEPQTYELSTIKDLELTQVDTGGLSKEDMAYILRRTQQDIEDARDYVRPLRTTRIDNYTAYRARQYGNEQKGRSKFVSSDIMDTIEWILPSLLKIFLSSDRVLSIAGRKKEDDEPAQDMEEVVDWQFQVENDGFVVLYEWFKDALLYPNADVETGWDKVVEVEKREFLTAEEMYDISLDPDYEVYEATPVTKSVDLPEVEEDGLPAERAEVTTGFKEVSLGYITRNTNSVECFHPKELLIQKGAKSIQAANFVAREYQIPFSELKEREKDEFGNGIYINLDKLQEKLRNPADGVDREAENEERQAALEHELNETEADLDTGEDVGRTLVTVARAWSRLDPKREGTGERYLVELANGEILIRAEPLPFEHGEVPIPEIKANIDPHQYPGIAIATELQQLQKLKTALTRQFIDNIAFQNNAFWLVRRGAGVDLKQLANPRPRGHVLMNDLDAIRKEVPDQIGTEVMGFLEYLDSVKEKRTGVTSYNQGTDADALNKTARGVTQIMAASQQRIETIARIFAETGVKDMMRQFIKNNQQFMTKKQTMRLLNKEVEWDPKFMRFRFDLKVNVGIGTGNKQQQVQDMTLIYQTLLNNQFLQAHGIVTPQEMYSIIEAWLKALGRQDIHRFVRPPAPAAPAAPGAPAPQPPQAGQPSAAPPTGGPPPGAPPQ